VGHVPTLVSMRACARAWGIMDQGAPRAPGFVTEMAAYIITTNQWIDLMPKGGNWLALEESGGLGTAARLCQLANGPSRAWPQLTLFNA
jgi:hypothetical protein